MLRRRGALLTLLGLLGCARRRDGPPLALPTPDAGGALPFDANELYDLYRKDGAAADRALRGKTVSVTSTVLTRFSSVDKDPKRPDAPPDLYLKVDHTSNGFWVSSDGVVCQFPESDRADLKRLIKALDPSDRVTVRGIVNGKLGSVFLKDCTLIAPASSDIRK